MLDSFARVAPLLFAGQSCCTPVDQALFVGSCACPLRDLSFSSGDVTGRHFCYAGLRASTPVFRAAIRLSPPVPMPRFYPRTCSTCLRA